MKNDEGFSRNTSFSSMNFDICRYGDKIKINLSLLFNKLLINEHQIRYLVTNFH